jgi:hypothetical protein
MPVRYEKSFTHTESNCPKTYSGKLRNPLCRVEASDKPYKPHNATPTKTQIDSVEPPTDLPFVKDSKVNGVFINPPVSGIGNGSGSGSGSGFIPPQNTPLFTTNVPDVPELPNVLDVPNGDTETDTDKPTDMDDTYDAIVRATTKEFTPTHDKPDNDTKQKAILANASYKANKAGLIEAAKDIEKGTNGKYVLDPDYSNGAMLTVINTETGKATIVYRGSANLPDWGFNVMNYFDRINSVTQSHPHQTKIDNHFKAVSKVYDVDEVVGHSKGGLHAIIVGANNNVSVTTFNAEIFGSNHELLDKLKDQRTKVTLHRVTTDPASYGLVGYGVKNRVRARNMGTIVTMAYPPLPGYESPYSAHSLQNFMDTETSRDARARTIRGSVVHQGGQMAGQAGIGIVANQATNAFLDTVSMTGLDIDPELRDVISDATSSALTEAGARAVGMQTVVGGRRISLATAAGAGVVSGEAQRLAQDAAKDALTSAGVDENTATILSSGAGGAVGGAVDYEASVAIAYASRQFGRNVISQAVRTAITEGVQRMGLAEVAGLIGGEAVTGAARGRWGGGYGALAGLVVGLGVGAFEVATAEQEQEIYAIIPTGIPGPDMGVRQDLEIRRLLNDFNDRRDFSETSVDNLHASIQARLSAMKEQGILGMDYPADIVKVPEHTTDENVMFRLSNQQISMINAERNRARQERHRHIVEMGNRVLADGLRDLLRLEAEGHYDRKRHQHLQEYIDQREAGTLPEYLELVFQEFEDPEILPEHIPEAEAEAEAEIEYVDGPDSATEDLPEAEVEAEDPNVDTGTGEGLF